MNKVFFDIGTNRFQGYDELSVGLGITEDWLKVFVEPNPDFTKDKDLVDKLNSIKHSRFIGAALCCNCEEDVAKLVIENGYHMDQGSNIFHKDWVLEGRPYYEVSVVNFEEICKDYLDCEWYMKFDCECCEWSCLEQIVDKYHSNIKFLACEFHSPEPDSETRGRIIEKINSKGISFQCWK